MSRKASDTIGESEPSEDIFQMKNSERVAQSHIAGFVRSQTRTRSPNFFFFFFHNLSLFLNEEQKTAMSGSQRMCSPVSPCGSRPFPDMEILQVLFQ